MDELSKYRLTGAIIWLVMLVIAVPIWFGEPVGFKPDGTVTQPIVSERPLVEHAFVLPETKKPVQPKEPVVDQKVIEKVIEKVAVKPTVASAGEKTVTTKVQPVSVAEKIQPVKSSVKPEVEQTEQKWIVRIIAYKKIESANDLLGRLEDDFEITIKSYDNRGVHSVRAGPYISKVKAEQAKRKLDKMLRTNSEVVKYSE